MARGFPDPRPLEASLSRRCEVQEPWGQLIEVSLARVGYREAQHWQWMTASAKARRRTGLGSTARYREADAGSRFRVPGGSEAHLVETETQQCS